MKNFHGSSSEASDNGAQKIIREAIIACISFYQKTFSPDHGIMRTIMKKNHCRFYPSCSAYAIQALRQYGLSKGLMVSVRRVSKCNPMHRGGYDPVII